MAWFFTLFFGLVSFFGIRMLRSGWAARRADQVGATVKLVLGWGFGFFGGIAFLISLAIALLSVQTRLIL